MPADAAALGPDGESSIMSPPFPAPLEPAAAAPFGVLGALAADAPNPPKGAGVNALSGLLVSDCEVADVPKLKAGLLVGALNDELAGVAVFAPAPEAPKLKPVLGLGASSVLEALAAGGAPKEKVGAGVALAGAGADFCNSSFWGFENEKGLLAGAAPPAPNEKPELVLPVDPLCAGALNPNGDSFFPSSFPSPSAPLFLLYDALSPPNGLPASAVALVAGF